MKTIPQIGGSALSTGKYMSMSEGKSCIKSMALTLVSLSQFIFMYSILERKFRLTQYASLLDS